MKNRSKILTFVHNILTSGVTQPSKQEDYNSYRSRSLLIFLNLTLITTLILSITIIVANILNTTPISIHYHVIISFALIGLILYLRVTKKSSVISAFILIFFKMATIYGMMRGGYMNSGILFFINYPILAYYIFGKKTGRIWNSIFICVYFGMILLISLDILPSPYDVPFLLMGGLSLLAINVFGLLNAARHENIENMMIRQIYYDSLTGLPNRRSLIEDLEEFSSPILILVNIDDFKEVNDIFGYTLGDRVLVFLSKRLKAIAQTEGAHLYKLSGDEFGILIENETRNLGLSEIQRIADRLTTQAVKKRYLYKTHEIILRITGGIAIASIVGKKKLFACSDMALKTAKNRHLPFMVFKEAKQTQDDYEKNIHWLNVLSEAIEQDRVVPFFQPIVDNKTGAIPKYECLVRILTNTGEVISPFFFLDVAKKSRLYTILTQVVITKSFEYFKDKDKDFSINLSVEDFYDSKVLDVVHKKSREYPEVMKRATFEIVESEGIENFAAIQDFIDEIHKLGAKIAIDDFGTGYSNFAYLLKMKIDYLKIDGSLIKNIHTDKDSHILVSNIVQFSKQLGIETIAEFVHCDEVYRVTNDMGVTYSQGFHFGKPEPEIDV